MTLAQSDNCIPSVVYKIRGIEQFKRDVRCLIKDRKLYCARPKDLNDPEDCYPRFISPPNHMHRDLIESEVAKAPPSIQAEVRRKCELLLTSQIARDHFRDQIYDSFNSSLGILSLTSSINYLLLWQRYADECQGFAVGYKLKNACHMNALEAQRVVYSSEKTPMLPFTDQDWARMLLFRKTLKWKNENEWRYIRTGDEGGPGEMSVPNGSIVEICLGPCMKPECKAEIVSAAGSLPDKPPILQGLLAKDNSHIRFEDCSSHQG